MYENEYWEPPKTATRTTLLNDYDREIDKRIIRSGRRVDNKTFGQAEASLFIEKLVNRIINYQQPAYELFQHANGALSFRETYIGSRLEDAICLLGLFDSYHDYSEHVLAFLHSAWTISSMYGVDLSRVGRNDFQADIHFAEAMNDLVTMIRNCTNEVWFQRSASDRAWESKQKQEAIAQHTATVLQYYASTTNVRINCGYRKQLRHRVTIDDVYAHLDKLLYMKDWHPLFQHLVGYAWHIEQGDERKGFHIHFSFLFNGSEMSGDVNMGFALMNLWDNEITGGLGETDICNANKQRYPVDRLGVGYFERTDGHGCMNVIEANKYLAKDTQYLRIKPKGRRAFGCGMAPDLANKRGRPSMKEPTWQYGYGV
jgi:hypothetical protein